MLPYHESYREDQASSKHPDVDQMENEHGVYIDELPVGAQLVVETGHTTYKLENRGHGKALIQGHPKFCPKPVLAEVLGASRGGAVLKLGYICEGFRMDFVHPEYGAISTSRVISVHPPSVS